MPKFHFLVSLPIMSDRNVATHLAVLFWNTFQFSEISSLSPFKQLSLCVRRKQRMCITDVMRASWVFLLKWFSDATSTKCIFLGENFRSLDFPSEISQPDTSFWFPLILARMFPVLDFYPLVCLQSHRWDHKEFQRITGIGDCRCTTGTVVWPQCLRFYKSAILVLP